MRFINIQLENRIEKEILLTPTEIKEFKANLKKSVLLSSASKSKVGKKENYPRVVSVVPSVHITPNKNDKGINKFKLDSPNKRGATRIENFRKSVIADKKRVR